MKKLAALLILISGISSVYAQEFKPSTAYKITVNGTTNLDDDSPSLGTLTYDVEQSITLTTFPLEAVESIETINVSELKKPDLDGIRSVLKIESTYTEYCSYIVAQYILVTTNGDYISLPSIGNTRCNDTQIEVQYIFPSQKLGTSNQIVRAQIGIDEYTSQHLVTEQIFIWNDDYFGTMAAITENH